MKQIRSIIMFGFILHIVCVGGLMCVNDAVALATLSACDDGLPVNTAGKADCVTLNKAHADKCKTICKTAGKPSISGVTECKLHYYLRDELGRIYTKPGTPPSGEVIVYDKCISEEQACAEDHARLENGRCQCLGNRYDWNLSTGKCDKDSLAYQKCNRASNARWDSVGGKCVCTKPDEVWNEKRATCEQSPCVKYSSFMAVRNYQCVCVKDEHKAPISRPSDYELDPTCAGGAGCCKLTAAAQQRIAQEEIEEQQKQQIKSIVSKIDTVTGVLNQLSQQMGKSHWKNASGGFNTARLASDSVAGVVLGTVGGVVTSNIIKKNQVKSGFENLQCVISGQSVAGYGDIFTVGIK